MRCAHALLALIGLMVPNYAIAAAQASIPVVAPKDTYGYFQCRADVQKWTYDPLDKSLGLKFSSGTGVLVNGQLRIAPYISYGATVGDLLRRIAEVSTCKNEDANFEKQFGTYSLLDSLYSGERTFRYMSFITKHNLDQQFIKEDAEAFK